MAAGREGAKPREGKGYAGDITADQAWTLLADVPKAQLVDVRTTAEWSFVGVPDLTPVGKQPILASWQVFPSMQVNPDFAAALEDAGLDPETPLVFVCRSGGRSKAAAIAMTERGFSRCYNMLDGFEGGVDGDGHRGTLGGWKASGLPWKQS